jgi:hypothetical protein
MRIPKNLNREHMLAAIAEIDRDGYDSIYEARTYSLQYNNRTYPPKHVVRIANRLANGRNLKDISFNPSEADRLLRRLGFTVSKILTKPATGHDDVKRKKESVIQIFVKLEDLLGQIQSKKIGVNIANLISDLEHSGKIPKHIAMRMHTMRITRNKVAHESYSLSPAQEVAYRADWETIQEWWREHRE